MKVYEVIQAIQQAAADASDHPYGTEDTGALQREKGNPITDSRVIDGFGTKIVANKLIVTYSTPVSTSTVHNTKFENDMEQRVADLVKYLKKKFKEETGSALKLKKDGEVYVRFEAISYVRSYAIATCVYEIGNYDKFETGTEGDSQERYDKIDRMLDEGYRPELAWKKWQQSSVKKNEYLGLRSKLVEAKNSVLNIRLDTRSVIRPYVRKYKIQRREFSPFLLNDDGFSGVMSVEGSFGSDAETVGRKMEQDLNSSLAPDAGLKWLLVGSGENRSNKLKFYVTSKNYELNESKEKVNYDNGHALSIIYDDEEDVEVALISPSGDLLKLSPHDQVAKVKWSDVGKLDRYMLRGGTDLEEIRKILGR